LQPGLDSCWWYNLLEASPEEKGLRKQGGKRGGNGQYGRGGCE